ncbi:Similar to C18orf63: Uncharacterized protein C18orf63 (Homo sapiens) [Cotesia congregata]|uniref:Similar to C18orf63: Uncharacterized protein C18orf63 (Homo sapiens) n=1 Tax=Cotesia congregata TaxID=51543 RepID=A0A8J2MW55_COTCN|nr:Similar to C18orf63: Uncharacterized protein C18orf63 (Homo sapiens) [Cotesia congregata]
MDENEFVIPVTARKSLCCIVCTVDCDDIKLSSAKSSWHWQKLKCRLLIYLLKDNFIVGSPIPRSNTSFYIIVTNDFYKSDTLTNIIKKLNLHASEPQPVTARAYITCIRYTIDFYLSPEWNKVATLYFQGDDFWKSTERSTAVQAIINLITPERSDVDKIAIILTPVKAKLPSLRLNDFCIPHSVISDFLADPNGVIDVSLFGNERVAVLPSLKLGKVLRIMKNIPSTCPYQNWTEMRRFWKNMYGYRLPKTSEGILFYDIKFPSLTPNDRFIYPDICIRSGLQQYSYGAGAEAVVKNFMTHLTTSMPKMCIDKLIDQNLMQITHQVDETTTEMKTPVNQQEHSCLVKSRKLSAPTLLKDCNIASKSDTKSTLTELKINEEASDVKYSEPKSATIANNRQLTNSMSPTKSLLRKPVEARPLNYDNLKNIEQLYQPITQTQRPRINIFKNASRFFTDDSKEARMRQAASVFSSGLGGDSNEDARRVSSKPNDELLGESDGNGDFTGLY